MSRRMIDHLLADGVLKQDVRTHTFHPWDMANLLSPDRRPALQAAEVYVIDNVTRHIYEEVPKEHWGVEDFPCCTPPGTVFWMETRAPQWIVNETGRHPWDGQYAWGALFIAEHVPAVLRHPEFPLRVHDGMHQAYAGALRALQVACARHHYPLPDDEPAEGAHAWLAAAPPAVQRAVEGLTEAVQARNTLIRLLRDDTAMATLLPHLRWTYTVRLFYQWHRLSPIHCLGFQGIIMIDTHGRIVEVPALGGGKNIGHWCMPHGEYVTAAEQQQYMTIGRVSLYPMLLALSWMQEAHTSLKTVDPCHPGGAKHHGRQCSRRHYITLMRQETPHDG